MAPTLEIAEVIAIKKKSHDKTLLLGDKIWENKYVSASQIRNRQSYLL